MNQYPTNAEETLFLMLERMNLFYNNKLTLQTLVSDLESLTNILGTFNPDLQKILFKKWEVLEEVNALLLCEEFLIGEAEAKSTIKNTLYDLGKVVEKALSMLQ